MHMKRIETNGITHIELIPNGTDAWYYGISYEHGDLYEAEEIFKAGHEVEGRELCLIHYPDGAVYRPLPKRAGNYSAEPVYHDGSIYLLNVDFPRGRVQIMQFDCMRHSTDSVTELPLRDIKDCYDLSLDTEPLMLTRQCTGTREFEILWPERLCLRMEEHESFFLRDRDKLYFNRWYEEGDGSDYRYWEETVVRALNGEVIDRFPGYIRVMPNGEKWYFI